jgi:tetratricopeptide (TPR) repeat protein
MILSRTATHITLEVVLFYIAQLYQKINQHDLAIMDYHSAIVLNPKKAKSFLNLGILYMRHSKNYPEALKYINKAIAVDPIGLKGYISRGELYEAMYREAMLRLANTNMKRTIRTTRMDHAAHYVGLAVKEYTRAIHIRPSNYILFLYRGKMLLKQGKVDEATADFHTAFDLNASIAQTFIQRALILSFQRKHKQIIEEYDERKKRLNLTTDDPGLLLLVAKARIRDGDFEGALHDLIIAGDQAQNDPQISLQKGICHEYLKNWYEASLEFSKCLEQIPTFSKAYYHRGICKLAEGDESGEEDLNKAIELEPKYFDAYITRAAFFESKGLFGKAIQDCDEALKIEPISIRAHILRGSCKCKLGLFPLAASDFSKAVSIDRNSHFAFYNRAIAYQASEDYLNAMKDYSIVLLLDDNVDAYRNRALLYWKLGDNQNALLDFIEAKRISPDDAKIRCLYALSLHKIGRFQESLEEYTHAMRLDGRLIEALLGRGNVYAELGDLENSRRDYCRVLHMHPRHADTFVNIAYTYQTEEVLKMAWKYFTMAFTVDNQSTPALEGRALINLAMKNPFAAYLDITRAIEIDPDSAQFLTNRGVIFEALNDNVSALQSYKLAIRKDPKYALAYFNAANHYLKQHHWEKAIEFYTKATEIDPRDSASYMNRAIAFSMLENYDRAKEDLQYTMSLDGDSATAYFNLGYVCNCLGDTAEAEKAFEKVIELAPDDPLAYQCRAEAYFAINVDEPSNISGLRLWTIMLPKLPPNSVMYVNSNIFTVADIEHPPQWEMSKG